VHSNHFSFTKPRTGEHGGSQTPGFHAQIVVLYTKNQLGVFFTNVTDA